MPCPTHNCPAPSYKSPRSEHARFCYLSKSRGGKSVTTRRVSLPERIAQGSTALVDAGHETELQAVIVELEKKMGVTVE